MTRRGRENISSDSAFEASYGYSRAVRVGSQVFMSGTTAIQADGTMGGGSDAYGQAMAAFGKIEAILSRAGAKASDIVRTRIFLKDIALYSGVERAHREFFGVIRPAATLVEVTGFVRPEMLLEVEVDVVISASDN
jgi:enamine deaminase RidA (YjgF/YER057c/UK114 family)